MSESQRPVSGLDQAHAQIGGLIAAAVVAILRTSHQAAAAIAAARRRPASLSRAPRRIWTPSALVVEPALVPVSSLSRRGPPRSPAN